jgi:hypothetical protein
MKPRTIVTCLVFSVGLFAPREIAADGGFASAEYERMLGHFLSIWQQAMTSSVFIVHIATAKGYPGIVPRAWKGVLLPSFVSVFRS